MALAAVGAGLLPATMAMLVPIMLGRRRRRSVDDDLLRAAKATAPTYPPPDQPLEAEDLPPSVIEYSPFSPRPRKDLRQDVVTKDLPRGEQSRRI